MNPSTVVIAAAGVGLVLNTLAVLGLAWRGGWALGQITTSLQNLANEVRLLRESKEEQTELVAGVVVQVRSHEVRLERLEAGGS